MDATEIERDILLKLEKIENNKNIFSQVLSENADASGSMNMPRSTQKKVVEIMNLVSNLGNKSNLDNFYSKYKTCGEFIESAEDTYEAMECTLKDMTEKFQLIREVSNSASVISDITEQLDPVTVSEDSWLDI